MEFLRTMESKIIEVNPLLVEIEEYLNNIKPTLKRVLSGRSGMTKTLTEDSIILGFLKMNLF